MATIDQSITLQPKSNGTITDYKYSPTGQYLAVADSQGFIQVYSRKDPKSYAKVSEFRADEGSIWSICWADAKYGNLIGIGSFRNKVAIFQESANVWKEIAYHELHRASVNWVQFAQQGLKLYAGSSDGQISILELSHKAWKSQAFSVGDSAIAAFALQQFPLGEIISEENNERIYPRVAVVTKDQKIKIWAHESQKLYDESQNDQKGKQINKSGYALLRQFATPKQTIRNVLWRPTWGSLADSLSSIPLITCSEEGFVKSLKLGAKSTESDKVQVILETEYQVTKISQSVTGNLLSASITNKNQQETYIYQNVDEDEWKNIKKGKL